MQISKAVISKKMDFLNEQIKKINQMDFDENLFVVEDDVHDLVVFRLQQAVETCIDIAAHILAGMDLSQKETAKDAFHFLGEKGIINKDLAFKMGKAADFRNRVVHGYNNFDFQLLFEDYQDNVLDLQQFGAEILKYLESS
jgi:uncharacterized protein YutE (UPF0331/DUF86 family)